MIRARLAVRGLLELRDAVNQSRAVAFVGLSDNAAWRFSMKIVRGLKIGFAAVALASIVMTGCVVTARPAAVVYDTPMVTVAPPAPQVEVIGVAPSPGYVWAGGYWNWEGGRHVWVAGHWQPGRPGYHWAPHRWVQTGGGWRLERGHWER
jgi:hypothetical protein